VDEILKGIFGWAPPPEPPEWTKYWGKLRAKFSVFNVFLAFLRRFYVFYSVLYHSKQNKVLNRLFYIFFQIKFKSKVDKLKNWIKVEVNFQKNLHPLPSVRGRIFPKNLDATFQLIRKSLVFVPKKNIIIPSRLSEKNCKAFHHLPFATLGKQSSSKIIFFDPKKCVSKRATLGVCFWKQEGVGEAPSQKDTKTHLNNLKSNT